MNRLQQQARFDAFVEAFNTERPHEALAMRCPAEVYTPQGPTPACRSWTTSSTTGTSWSPPAAVSAGTARRSTSRPCSPVRGSESKKWTTAFGSSASCTTIWDISTSSRESCKPSTTRSARGCHPCLRYKTLPISPGRTEITVVAGAGFEPRAVAWLGRGAPTPLRAARLQVMSLTSDRTAPPREDQRTRAEIREPALGHRPEGRTAAGDGRRGSGSGS
jgi:hypothetical protein